MTAVVVSGVEIRETPTGVRVTGRLRGGDDLPPSLWFEVPAAFAGALHARGDAFLPALFLRALHRRSGPVVIEAPVSPALLAATRRIEALLATWGDGAGRARVEIQAPIGLAPTRGAAAGALFSGGVDSFYTLLKNVDRYPAGDSRSIRHLVMLHGFDVKLEDTALFEQLAGRLREAGEALGLGFVPLRTNARMALHGLDWDLTHGAVLAGAGHAMAGLLHTVFVAAAYPYGELRPWGTHPCLDPLWSSERVEFVHDGAELSRPDKIAAIARSEVALRALRVCWANTDGSYNCGRCEKCVRTMLALAIEGVLARAPAFPPRLDPDAIERIYVPEFIRGR
ncbi:MAG: hypothetical protein L0027_05385, partial [Candidatus Rokubacteria bacterium]|nr:hypothetical protein [Candidatus Rokubacteria bacterium]